MQKTNSKTNNHVWFRAPIPASVNEGLKRLAKEKTALHRGKCGAAYTKESVIVALLTAAVDARQSGKLTDFAKWLFDGKYSGKYP